MAIDTTTKTGFDTWRDGIDSAANDARWHSLDCEIQATVDGFNRYLSSTRQYKMLDWRLIKAMVWVETGAATPEWDKRPMRIGVPGEAGLAALLAGAEGDLILPPAWKEKLTPGSVRTIPRDAIRAGVGYLLMRMANYAYRSVPGADTERHDLVVNPGDSLARLAETQGGTSDALKKRNPPITVLRPGHMLTYRTASVQCVVTGWRPISTTSIAHRYNGGRDPHYAKKLDHALRLIWNPGSRSCAK